MAAATGRSLSRTLRAHLERPLLAARDHSLGAWSSLQIVLDPRTTRSVKPLEPEARGMLKTQLFPVS